MKETEFENKLICGDRSEIFVEFLIEMLMKFSLSRSTAENILKNDKIFSMYKNVFTHKVFDSKNNYEFYELIGDVSCNKIIV